jgi:hypothetical protein
MKSKNRLIFNILKNFMKKSLITLLLSGLLASAQTNPIITKWLQNTTTTGTYYVSGNSTAISNGILVNCQQVRYSTNWAYINATGIPAYPVGPFTGDGNPNNAGNQNAIYKLPLVPTQNTGTSTPTSGGTIGVFINGVSMFDYRDGVSWKNSTGAFAGGPGGGMGDGVWNRDAIVYEKAGFDCSKGHPAGTNYHHHQNPSAFDLDLNIISSICNLYDADGLYTINPTQHSPLIGFAADGFPVYGAYGYANVNGTGSITRIKSGYQLRNISVRTHYANGTDVTDGPAVSTTYPLGTFREDYEWVSNTDTSYLDTHNGRFCVTPEYPAGSYCYFATVNATHNSAYPYLIGPTYYGNKTGSLVTTVSETTTTYIPSLDVSNYVLDQTSIKIVPNPATDLIAIQMNGLVKNDLKIDLYDVSGKLIKSAKVIAGQSIAYFDVQDVYNGTYFVKITDGSNSVSKSIIIKK